MRFSDIAVTLLCASNVCSAGPLADIPVDAKHQRPSRLEKRQKFDQGQPIDAKGRGDSFSGGTNHQIDLDNPDNLGAEGTDGGTVPNLKWSFSGSKIKLFKGGWVREQVVSDLPASQDLSAAQLHLTKGAVRELHWHRVAEWAIVTAGSVRLSAVDENGRSQIDVLQTGDIWYFPKGAAHTFQGLEEANEFLLVFDDGNFDAVGTTYMVDDWLMHTPKSILAKNFNVNESVFAHLPKADPYITPPMNISASIVSSPSGEMQGNSSFVYHLSKLPAQQVPGGGGTLAVVDSRNFPIATTIAAAVVTLEPGGLRELHWHPNAAEWLYFQRGQARATVFIGAGNARTFDFQAGDTAVFPDNSGHYIENLSATEPLLWLELYKSDRVVDISLSQWLALTPPEIVAQVLAIPVAVVDRLKKEKQVLLKGREEV